MSDWQPAMLTHPATWCAYHAANTRPRHKQLAESAAGDIIYVRPYGPVSFCPDCAELLVRPDIAVKYRPELEGIETRVGQCQVSMD